MHTIQILGVKDHSGTNLLFSNVQQALLELDLRFKPKVVDDVGKLMAFSIDSIPALVVRGQVVSQQYIPETDELRLFFKTIFLADKIPVAMKNILVPTDFSDTAANAFEYAKQLAAKTHASIKVVHVHYPDMNAMEATPPSLQQEAINWKKKRIKRFAQQYPADQPEGEAGLLAKIDTEIAIGFPGEHIVSESESDEVDLIVMGTTGESGFFEKMFGSISSHVARKARCPVLLVPNGVKFKECSNILFATNHQAADEILLEAVPNMMACPSASVHFVHVDESTEEKYKVKDISFLKPDFPSKYHFVEIQSKDTFAALSQYAKEQGVDAMVMVTTHRPLLNELFHKSLTKRMALNTEMPLLVMHYDKRE